MTSYSDKIGRLIGLVTVLTAAPLAVAPASAQPVTGVLGSPGGDSHGDHR